MHANEDSPERVEAAIARFVEVNRLDRSTEENRKTYATMLMEQAEALVAMGRVGAGRQAGRSGRRAAGDSTAPTKPSRRPRAADRRLAATEQPRRPPAVDPPYPGPDAVGPSLAGRQQAVELMRQIRARHGRGANPAGRIALPPARGPADPG